MAVLAAIGVSLIQEPAYEAKVRLILEERKAASLFEEFVDRPDPARTALTEIEVIKSEPVRDAVLRRFGPGPKPSVRQVKDTDVIEVRARAGSRDRARAVTRAYATEYIDFRRSQAVKDIGTTNRRLEAKIRELERQIATLEEEIEGQGGAGNAEGIAANRDNLIAQKAAFKTRLDELEVEAELETGGAQLVTVGRIPVAQVAPDLVRAVAVALAAGLVLSIALAFLLEALDDAVRTKEDLARVAPGVAVLALIPKVQEWKSTNEPVLVTMAQPDAPAAESFRSLRTALQFVGIKRAPQIIQVTSANAEEGKTASVSNLAVVMARSGQRVVLVDCDLRRPRLHEFFGLPNEIGFTSVFLGEVDAVSALQPVPDVPNLRLLPCGPLPPNPSEVLSEVRTRDVLYQLRADADVVLVDSPPILPVADPVALSVWVEATLLVVAAGQTTNRDVQRSIEVMTQGQAPLVGIVLNKITAHESYNRYGYTYGGQRRPADAHGASPPRGQAFRPGGPEAEAGGPADGVPTATHP